MSLLQPIDVLDQFCSSSLDLALDEVVQARDWAAALSRRTGDVYRAEVVSSEAGAVIVGIATPSSKDDIFIRPGDFNWHLLRTPSGVHLSHPVTGGPVAIFADIDSALAEIAMIEEGLASMSRVDPVSSEDLQLAA